MKKSCIPSLAVAGFCNLCFVASVQSADFSEKVSSSAKFKVEPKVGENGKVGGAIDVKGKKEISAGYGPVTGKLTEDGPALEVGYEKKFTDTQVKLKGTLQGSVDRAEKTDFYPEGVPSLKVTASVGAEASTGVGPASKVSVGGSVKVYEVKADPMQARKTNERLKETLKAANGEEYLPEKPAPTQPTKSKYSMPEKHGMSPDERIAEMRKEDEKARQVLAEAIGNTRSAPAPAPAAASPATPPAEHTVSGYMTLPRPADIPDDDWQMFSRTLAEQTASAGLNGVVQVDGRQIRIRFEKVPESSFNQMRGSLQEMGYTIQFDR